MKFNVHWADVRMKGFLDKFFAFRRVFEEKTSFVQAQKAKKAR